MTHRVKLIPLAAWVLLFGAPLSHADDAALFCSDAYAAICGPNDELGLKRDELAAKDKWALKLQAWQQLARAYGFSPPDQGGAERFMSLHPELEAKFRQDFLELLRRQSVVEIGDASLTWQNRIEEQIRGGLLAAIDAAPHLSSAERTSFKASLSTFVLVDAAEIIERGESHPLWHNFAFQCSPSGLRDNAFHPPGTNYLVLCPGLILAARQNHELSAGHQDMSSTVAWSLAHETGHGLDATVFPPAYESMRACVESKFVRTRTLPGFEGVSPAEYTQRLNDHMEEIAADHWANEALAIQLQNPRFKKKASLESKPLAEVLLAEIRQQTQSLCGLHATPQRYGSDRFRIGILLGQNPRLRKVMGCGPTAPDSSYCEL